MTPISFTPTGCVYLRATNDKNGNPRRGWLFINQLPGYRDTHVFVNEGYKGIDSVPAEWRPIALHATGLNVTLREYKRWLDVAAVVQVDQ